jgi:DNA mismatch repair protein MutS
MANQTNSKRVGFRQFLERERNPTDERGFPKPFTSILYERPEDRSGEDTSRPPAFFTDLNCDQIVNAVVSGRDEYNLRPFFHDCLKRMDAIRYRQEVMQDLDRSSIYDSVSRFAEKMREVREHFAE